MESWLIVMDQGIPTHRIPVQGILDLGRGSASDLLLTDTFVSSVHARVSQMGNRLEVRDLGSINGTFVNGNRVVRRRLYNGDKLRLGPHATLEVKLRASENPQPLVLEREDGEVRVAVQSRITHIDNNELVRVPDMDAVFFGAQLVRLGELVRIRGTGWRLHAASSINTTDGVKLPYRLEQDAVGPEIVDLARPGRKVRLTRPTTQRLVRAMCELAPDGGWVEQGSLMDAVWGDRSRPNRLYLNLYRFRRKLEEGGLDPAAVETSDGRVRLHIAQFALKSA